ncbi:MAG: SDR family oxidoreductase [Spirochaetes bacterium]|nr:SDR family oxidoreductase [Spirochaetota bacterium]
MKNSKVILITGASSGIGEACAVYLSKKGHKVYGTSRKVKATINKENYKLLKLDVTNNETIKTCIEEVIMKEGKIDVLVNNAGLMLGGPIESASPEEIELIFKTNILGQINLIKEILPYMRKEGKGLIINIGSIGSIFGLPFQGLYSSTKFALYGLTQALSLEVENFGIKVTIINPGDTKTNVIKNRMFPNNPSVDIYYQDQFEKTKEIIEKEEKNGMDPYKIAKFIAKLINKKTIKNSYIIAKPSQKLACILYKLLGFDLFKFILKIFYKINNKK